MSAATSCVADQLVVDRGHRVLPELRLRHPGAEVARDRPHVAVQQLVPGPREGVGELVGVLEEAPRDPLVDRVDAQRQVRGQHRRLAARLVGLGVRDDVRRASFATHCLAPAGLSVSSHS